MPRSSSYQLESGDKATPVTIYLAQTVIRGDLVTREMIRVSNWLRLPGLPDYATLFDVTVVRAVGSGAPEVVQLPEVHTPVTQIIALHLSPPGADRVEYDQNEQNRKMEPVAAFAGPFRFDGSLRMPGHLNLSKQMALMRDPFILLYDLSVYSALEPGNVVKTPTAILRPGAFSFARGTG